MPEQNAAIAPEEGHVGDWLSDCKHNAGVLQWMGAEGNSLIVRHRMSVRQCITEARRCRSWAGDQLYRIALLFAFKTP